MKTIINSLKAIVACAVLLMMTPPAEAMELETVGQPTVQQCSLEEETPVLLIHGRHPYHYHPPHPPHHYSSPHYYPSVYPPYPYYAPYPASSICRNQVFFCQMNTVLPVGSQCVLRSVWGGVVQRSGDGVLGHSAIKAGMILF